MNEIEKQSLAAALGRVTSGIFVLSIRDGGREDGLLASWVQQCSFDPPGVTVCVKQGRDVLDRLSDGAVFTLNVLADGQTQYLSHFGRGFGPGEDAFAGLAVERDGDALVLPDALAHLRCRVTARASGGDHEVIVATVTAGKLHREGEEPMVHVRKNGLKY